MGIPVDPAGRRRRPAAIAALLVASLAAGAPCADDEVTLDAARELHRAGKLTEALAAYREVAARAAQTDPLSAAIAHNNACVLLLNTGDHTAAVAECRSALELARRLDDPRRLGRTLNNLALALQYVGEFDEATERFRDALEINEEQGDVEGQVINWANLGVVATEAGRYADALRCHEHAQQLAERHPEQPWAAEQRQVACINRAVVLERIGAYDEALELYAEQLAAGSRLDTGRRANLVVNTGVIYRNLGDPVRALAAFESAAASFRELNDRAALSNAILNQALVLHLNLERPADAEVAYRRALELTRQTGDRPEEIRVLCSLGRLLLEHERLVEAGEAFDACRAVAAATDSSEGRWRAAEGAARVAAASGEIDRALDAVERAIAEIEAVRVSLARSELRQHYFGEKRSIYAFAVELLATRALGGAGTAPAERALELAQRAKARSLLDAIGPAGPHSEPLSAGGIAERIGDDLLLEYFFGERRLYGWAVRAGRVRIFDAGPAELRRREIDAVHAALERGDRAPPGEIGALSAALLAEAEILDRGAERTWIAPDGRLHFLPFELLPLPGGDEPLIRRTEVGYLPSASILALSPRTEPGPATGFAGIGAPSLPAGDERFPSPAGVVVRRYGLTALPDAAREIEAIRDSIPGPGEVRVGDDATEENLARLVRQGTRVLHVATHSVVGESVAGGAAIVLTPTETSDGLLQPAEIARLGRAAELTVLASCRSALGPAAEGDALAVLTGAFLAAGSPAVVATLWDVDDAASRVFMEQFYHHLGRGRTPSAALRAAKLAMIDDERWV
ncbi:MAG TPA: CHAT domain-containing tetratricopeptide repeat protein, partial [Candidatus Polarisedimenticolaceae bacterium]|nr:CHAT domain-containing tetratricopeptide repeat protein [Candidatus Polarisedimenticolaceae bacterium]